MADFLPAFLNTAKTEGGYSNYPNDTGGETYAGISRKNWPNWGGWRYLDEIKKIDKTPSYINVKMGSNQNVQALVQEFYKTNFWYSLNLQWLNDQQLANNVYDFAVSSGTGTAAKRLQIAANSICGDLVVDGQIGSKTISAINKLDAKAVYDAFNQQRKAYYDRIIANNPSQAQFRNSWYSRITPYKA